MKRMILVLGLLLPLSLYAQTPLSFGVHANGAALNVPEPLKDVYGAGFGGGAHLDLDLLVLSLRLSGDYISFSPDNNKYLAVINSIPGVNASALDGGRLSIISGHVNGKLPLLPVPVISPYVTGGVGLSRISVDDVKVTVNGVPVTAPAPSPETKTTINLGAGLDLKLGIALFIEARYTWIFTEGETSTYVPVTLGITF